VPRSTTAARERGARWSPRCTTCRGAAHFPRIVGLRDGQLVFDLPAAQVTPQLLQHCTRREDELAAARAAKTGRRPQPVR
jgi:phosphonate transport system ATP-binding protein